MTNNNTTKQWVYNSWMTSYTGGVLQVASDYEVPLVYTQGQFVLNGVTPVTVLEPNITNYSSIAITFKTLGGSQGAVPTIQTRTTGSGFTVSGTVGDTSTYQYLVIG